MTDEKEMPDLLERLFMFGSLVSNLIGDDELIGKSEQLGYSLNNFSDDDLIDSELFYQKIEVFLNEIFSRLNLAKLDPKILNFPQDTPELKLIHRRLVLLAAVPLLIEGSSEKDFLTNQQVILDLLAEADSMLHSDTDKAVAMLDDSLNIEEDIMLNLFYPERYDWDEELFL